MGDFFCYYAVLNSFDVNFRNNGENFWYYLNPVIAVAVLFVLIAVLSEIRKKHFVIGILVVFTLFQYGSLVLKCDKVSADSALIWGDALYDLLKEEPDAFEDVDEVYYISERPGETVQVVLRDTPVYIRVPAEKTDNMVLYMDSIDDVFDKVCFDFSDMKPYMLDENEIIVTNNRSLEDKLGKYIKGR